MASRWTPDDDRYLVEYEDAGAANLARDKGRTPAAVQARIKHLRETGAWDAYVRAAGFMARAIRLAGHPDPFDVALDREQRMDALDAPASPKSARRYEPDGPL